MLRRYQSKSASSKWVVVVVVMMVVLRTWFSLFTNTRKRLIPVATQPSQVSGLAWRPTPLRTCKHISRTHDPNTERFLFNTTNYKHLHQDQSFFFQTWRFLKS
jgi:hypothetical protein